MKKTYKKIISVGVMASVFFLAATPQANPKAADQSTASWSVAQIDAQIQRLESEQAQRVALLQINNGQELMPSSASASIFHGWFTDLLLLLGMGAVPALLLLLWQFKRESTVTVFDWERSITMPPKAGKKNALGRAATAPAAAVNSRQGFDAIEYEVVRVNPEPEQEFGDATGQTDAMELIEQTSPLAQARFWATLGKDEHAIAILEQWVDQEHFPQCCMLLLDLYKKGGQRAEYELTRQRFKKRFNGKVPTFDDAVSAAPLLRLTDMPTLVQRINEVMPTNGIYQFLRKLLLDERQGSRQGFDYGVYCDLVRLYESLCQGDDMLCCEAICQA
ncbi:MAG: hypothetical protein RL748_1600 [Pseudomonadota bacterium]|jgi:hypothetical protein